MIKRLLSREVSVYDSIQRSTIVTTLKKIYIYICCQRRLQSSWLICWKIPWEAWGIRSFNNFPIGNLYNWRKIVPTKNKVLFHKLFHRVIERQIQWNNTSLIEIFGAMAIVLSFPSLKTWKSLFQTLVKAFRSQETILVFNNYTDNQESSSKQQERVNPFTNSTVRVYMGEMPRKCSKVKPISNTLKTQKKKLN